MMISRRFGRVQSLLATGALVAGMLVVPFAGVASSTPSATPSNGGPQLERAEAMAGLTMAPVVPADARRGELGSIELRVDSTSDDAPQSVFTFGTNVISKVAFGNRFTIPAAQAPFALTGVAGVLATLADGTGFEAGEQVGILIFTDPASTGNISNAALAFSGVVTLETGNVFLGVSLADNPVVIKQGDIYVIFADLTTDAEDTPVPVILAENGGSTDPRSFVSTNLNVPGDVDNPGGYFRLDATGLVGNVIVRGFGELAGAADLVTGGGQTVNAALPGAQNPSAIGTSPVTLSYDAPPVQTQAEVEPNNSAPTAQPVEFNKVIQAVVKTSDTGTDGFEDWFAFTVTEAGPFTIEIVDDGGVDLDMFLYNQTNTAVEIASSAGDCGARELIEDVVLQPGTYVVAIDAFVNPNCEAVSNTNYELLIVGPGGVRLTGYNVFCGTNENFEANAQSYIGTVGASVLSLVIQESNAGAYYRVSAVYGDEQSTASAAVTGSPCEGGPTFTSVKVKRNGNGSITVKGGAGDLTGVQLLINGVGFSAAPKVKVAKHQVKQKGPLANGQTVAQACPAGCTITVITNAGCSTVVGP